jgi:hypothetical protein
MWAEWKMSSSSTEKGVQVPCKVLPTQWYLQLSCANKTRVTSCRRRCVQYCYLGPHQK